MSNNDQENLIEAAKLATKDFESNSEIIQAYVGQSVIIIGMLLVGFGVIHGKIEFSLWLGISFGITIGSFLFINILFPIIVYLSRGPKVTTKEETEEKKSKRFKWFVKRIIWANRLIYAPTLAYVLGVLALSFFIFYAIFISDDKTDAKKGTKGTEETVITDGKNDE